MGVDGTGRGGRPRNGAGEQAPSGAASAAARRLAEPPAAVSPALEQLRRGEIRLDEYLDIQVEQAVRHLQGSLPEEKLELVRETLRAQLESDPALVELVERATGMASTDEDR